PDFGYFYYGSIWYGDELWNGGIMADENDDGERDQMDALIWDDRDNGGANFKPWTPARHPVYGDVEVGGFHPKFFSQNGPPNVLERWASRQALFNLEMAHALPELAWEDVRVRRVEQHDADSATYEVRVQWRNDGELPTALRQAQLVKIVQEDMLNLSFVRDTAAAGTAPRIIEPDLRGRAVWSGWTEPGETKTVTYRVRVYGTEPVRANLRLDSTRGGVLRREITIGG
ncbi:MAG TPA: hypothetical protein VHG09_12155, partial [Longimicrobiales bacterium]|nr:hypothetical protein [Longimicrobiales bacterium]